MKSDNSAARPRQMMRAVLVSLSMLAGACAMVPAVAHADVGDVIASLIKFGNRTTVQISSPAGELRMRINGDATFNDAEDDMIMLTDSAFIQQKRNGRTQRMTFQADGVGGIKRTYTVDGHTQPVDAEARRWLADVVPSVMRESSVNSAKRIKRIYGKSGADGVLAEIALINSDHSRRIYIEGLSQLGALTEKQLDRLVDVSADLDSDFERRSALGVVIRTQPLGTAHQIAVLKVVTKMTSSFEQRGLLTSLMPKLADDPAVMRAWVAAVADIDSDFEMRGAIDALVKRGPTPLQLESALQASMNLDSSFEHSSALNAISKLMGNATPGQVSAYLDSARKIDSDFERRSALVALLNRARLDKAGYANVLNAISGMRSDFEIRTVLISVAEKMPADGELVASYRRAARKLGDFERGQAEKALDHLNL